MRKKERLLFITARLEHENELNIHEHAVFVNKEPGQLHYGELNTNKHEQKFAKNVRLFTRSRPLERGPSGTASTSRSGSVASIGDAHMSDSVVSEHDGVEGVELEASDGSLTDDGHLEGVPRLVR